MSVDSGQISEGWKVYQLQELCEGGTLPYGIVQPGTHEESGVPIVRVNNFRGNYIDCSDLLKVRPEISEKYKRTILKGNEVLLTIVGSVGQVACTNSSHFGFNVARAIAVIRPNNLIEAKWIALSLESPQAKETLLGGANTTVQTTINLKELRQLHIAVPPKSYRLRVINLLQGLEQFAENLREQNATLEALAQNLFRSWFVNFDPVRAKAAGQTPEGMSPELAALFPSEFVESELGMIPKGWKFANLGNACEIHDSKRVPLSGRQRATMQGNIPYYGATSVMDHVNDYIFDGIYLLVGEDGSVAKPDGTPFTQYIWGKSWVNNHAHVLEGKNGYSTEFLLVHLNMTDVSGFVTGAVQLKINQANLKQIPIIQPSQQLLASYDRAVSPLFSHIRTNFELIKVLQSLRDELLPRLISGKLHIEKAEEAVAEVLSSTAEEEKAA